MARKKSAKSSTKEPVFLGNSVELKKYLIKKQKFFKNILEEQKELLLPEQIRRIKSFIDAIDDMLDQKYFEESSIYTMPEMIEAIKLERMDLAEELKQMEPILKEAKQVAEDAFKHANGYLANKYEVSIYNSLEQETLRNLIDEYQAIEWEYKSLEECRTILWWLLGVIHRPIGFFEKVIN